MSRAACTFRQRDAAALVKAVRAAGYEAQRVEVDKDGKIVVVIGKPGSQPANNDNGNDRNEEIVL